ncbi:hypothetical protein RIVM261_028640 [Rivularia sp. IAM M-261]|nr:hypothetical protein RIVM261_028640 [Rivularia sp. IAM M-261]
MNSNLYQTYVENFSRFHSLPDEEYKDSNINKFLPAAWQTWLPADKSISILDFGCGWGHFLLALHQLGYRNLTGIDSSIEMCQVAKQSLPENITIVPSNDSHEWLSSQTAKFDLVTMNNVIEHIPIDVAVPLLRTIKESLKPGGHIFISTPNMAGVFGSYTRYVDLTHVVGFTEFSLFQLLDLVGFKEHQITSNIPDIDFSKWRPWKPWRGLGLTHSLRRVIFSSLFRLSGTSPLPTCFISHLDVLSKSS